MPDAKELIERLYAFARQWVKGTQRSDVIYEIHDNTGAHILRAGDLNEAADTITTLKRALQAKEDGLRVRDNRIASLQRREEMLREALVNIKRRTTDHADDTPKDDKRDKRLAHLIARQALEDTDNA